jgi:hypothetical protein
MYFQFVKFLQRKKSLETSAYSLETSHHEKSTWPTSSFPGLIRLGGQNVLGNQLSDVVGLIQDGGLQLQRLLNLRSHFHNIY